MQNLTSSSPWTELQVSRCARLQIENEAALQSELGAIMQDPLRLITIEHRPGLTHTLVDVYSPHNVDVWPASQVTPATGTTLGPTPARGAWTRRPCCTACG